MSALAVVADMPAPATGDVLRLVVHGTPAPQGSKSFKGLTKTGRAILAESSKKVKPWREQVHAAAAVALAAMDRTTRAGFPIDGPLSVRMVFTLPKPASAPKRTRTWPIRYPDLSKLIRSTEDALTQAGVWADDARVVEVDRAAKAFPGEDPEALPVPGALIVVRRVMP